MKSLEKQVIRKERVSDQLRDILKRMILDGEVSRGVKLPTEEQFARQFQVSKVTVREALRNLETEGLIEKRRGVYGGSYVAHPGSEKIGEWVVNYLRLGTITNDDLVDFRRLFEPSLVELAAERRTEQDLAAIRAVIEEIEEGVRTGTVGTPKAIEFHRLIGDACHNHLVSMVMNALVKVFEEILARIPFTMDDAKYDLQHCRDIYHSLLQGKKTEARNLMTEHFDRLAEIVREYEEGRRGA